jgi:methyl-accepting chemotaxis protein/methyl-accepting chemotaxis protein-1 (serine sensor receptor)
VKVKTLVDEVNLGSQEQARGIEQISKAIAQMDQVTQGTAASAEEGASASQQLSAQAEAMGHAVRKLSRMVSDTSEAHARPAVAGRAPKPKPIATRARASPGLRALRPPVSKGSLQPEALAESPTDAQFLESFEEM